MKNYNIEHPQLIALCSDIANQIVSDFNNFEQINIFYDKLNLPAIYVVMLFLKGNINITNELEKANIVINTNNKLKINLETNLEIKYYSFFNDPNINPIFPWELNGEDASIDDAILRLSQYHNVPEEHYDTFSKFLKRKPNF